MGQRPQQKGLKALLTHPLATASLSLLKTEWLIAANVGIHKTDVCEDQSLRAYMFLQNQLYSHQRRSLKKNACLHSVLSKG